MSRLSRGRLLGRTGTDNDARLHLLTYGTSYLLLGLSLLLQADRWTDTASFGLIFRLMPAHVWGALLVAVSLAKIAAAVRYPGWSVPALMAGTAITAAWSVGFVLRYFSDDQTAPAAAVAWLLLLFIHVRQAGRIDRGARP